jgi:CheY-like chemotaxis protein
LREPLEAAPFKMAETISKKKILVVEDDIENQRLFKLILSRTYSVDFCDNDKSFYSKLASAEYDLILMDITLREGKTGTELTREIKSSKVFSNIPVLCLSAHVFEQDKRKAMAAGVDMFLEKPVSNKVLFDSIELLLSKSASLKS